jgi:hypothetical protein
VEEESTQAKGNEKERGASKFKCEFCVLLNI